MSHPKFTVNSDGVLRADPRDVLNSDAAQRQMEAVERLRGKAEMSDVRRYNAHGYTDESKFGEYVLYEDYERLERECAELRKKPMQPIELDDQGVRRFRANKIVRHLLDNGGIDMNALGCLDFSDADRQQFAQLIGYSLNGYSELSYVDDPAWDAAERMAEQKESPL